MASRIKEGVIRGAIAWVTQHALSLAWPFATTAFTVIAGWATGVPWFYIIVGAVVVSAYAITGLLRFEEWRARHSVRDKLNFESVSVGFDYIQDATGKTVGIAKVQLGLTLKNIADVPISYIVDEITSSFEGRINPKPTVDTKGGIIGAQAGGLYRDASIDVQDFPIKDRVEAILNFRIRYGRPGFEKHEIARKLNVVSPFDAKAGLYPGNIWRDAPLPGGKSGS